MRFHKTALVCIVILVLIPSCSRKGSAVLEDVSCEAPCWRNIEIGKTGIEETVNLLNKMPDIDPNTIGWGTNYQTGLEVVSAGFINSKETSLKITFEDGKAVAIYFSYRQEVSLAEVIRKFGSPSYFYPSALAGDPLVYFTVKFDFPEIGVCLHHEYQGWMVKVPTKYRIGGNTKISRIYFVDPALPHGQIMYGCLYGGDEFELDAMKQEWKGFGDYQIP